jgi:triphosphatase
MARSARRARKPTSPAAAGVRGRASVATPKASASIASGDSVGTAFGKIARGCLVQLREHQPSVLERGDAVGIHKMRVAVRRLRASFSLFEPLFSRHGLARLKSELQWLAGELAPARDWGVFREETLAPHDDRTASDRAAQRVRALTADRYAAAQERAVAAVGSLRYAALVLALDTWLETKRWRAGVGARKAALAARSIDKLAPALLDRRARKLHKAARSIADLTVEQRHALRKRLKALRYGANFLAILFKGRRVKPYLAALGAMQDTLGTINDLAVAKVLLTTLRAESRGALGTSLAMLDAAFAARLIDKLATLPAAWRGLRKTRPFWD